MTDTIGVAEPQFTTVVSELQGVIRQKTWFRWKIRVNRESNPAKVELSNSQHQGHVVLTKQVKKPRLQLILVSGLHAEFISTDAGSAF